MSILAVLLFAASVAGAAPLELDAERGPDAIEVRFRLVAPLPAEFVSAVDSGAELRLTYPLRVKARRKAWWDRKVWSGEVVTTAHYDGVTGRYRCELVLDGIITASREVESIPEVRSWLTAPPPIRIELPENRRAAMLKVRVRAVFATGTTWLIFPTQDATPWAELQLPPITGPEDDD